MVEEEYHDLRCQMFNELPVFRKMYTLLRFWVNYVCIQIITSERGAPVILDNGVKFHIIQANNVPLQ